MGCSGITDPYYWQGPSGSVGTAGSDGHEGSAGGIYKSSGNVYLKNSLIANNVSTNVPDCYGALPFNSLDFNIIGDGVTCPVTWQTNDKHDSTASPLNLGPLAGSMSPLLTHAVLPGSVALDAIPYGSNGCGTDYRTDQRGFPRPVNGFCEIGAFEAGHLFDFLPILLR